MKLYGNIAQAARAELAVMMRACDDTCMLNRFFLQSHAVRLSFHMPRRCRPVAFLFPLRKGSAILHRRTLLEPAEQRR